MRIITIQIDRGAEKIIRKLHRCGYEGFVVGGCVRDSLIGKDPADWDICTNATPDQVKEVLGSCSLYDTGIKHGTITAINEDGMYEITTYRTEVGYADHRRPDEVFFVASLAKDLSRRDFTINAMAYNDDGLVDLFGGESDLRDGLIRCVGDPNERFKEDALRVLRAFRFAAVFGFEVEAQTCEAAIRNLDSLRYVSAERIRGEFTKLLMGKYAYDVMHRYPEIVTAVIPEMLPCVGFDQKSKWHDADVYEHTIRAVGNYKGSFEMVRWALLLHDIEKPRCCTEDDCGRHFYGHAEAGAEAAGKILARLKFDNRSKADIITLIKWHARPIEPTRKAVCMLLNAIGEDRAHMLMKVRRADQMAHATGWQMTQKTEAIEKEINNIIKENVCFSLKDLAVNGRDIMALGIPEGKEVGDTLGALLNDVISGNVFNRRDDLMEKAKTYIPKFRTEE